MAKKTTVLLYSPHFAKPREAPGYITNDASRFAAVKFGDSKGAHQVYLARGQDRAGNTYADPTKSYPEVMAARGASTRYKNSH